MTRTTFTQRRQGTSLGRLVAPVMLAGLAALILSSWSGVASAQQGPALWPAYYNGTEVTIMMGPADNSSGNGPDVSKARQPLPIMYALAIPTATQMNVPVWHDMVLTALPGDRDYNAKVAVVWCVVDDETKFSLGLGVYKSEAAVFDGMAAHEITCEPIPLVVFAQVVHGKSGK
jgi:hypothetical protein